LPEEVSEIEWADVLALFAYWRTDLPVHEILKAVYKIQPKKEPTFMTFEAMRELMKRTGGKIEGLR